MILTEHRLEEVFPMADRALVLEDGRLLADGAPVRRSGGRSRRTGTICSSPCRAPCRFTRALTLPPAPAR